MDKICSYESANSFTIECFAYKVLNDFKFCFLFFLFSLIIIYTICINFVVFVSILMDRLRNRLDICFISNAFSDLLIGLFVLPVLAAYSLFGFIPLNESTCSTWIIFELTINTTSMLHFTYISYDRYLSVLKPVKYSSNNRHTITYIILIMLYVVSALCWLPLIVFLKSKNFTKQNMFSLTELNQTNRNKTEVYNCRFELMPSIIVPHSVIIFYVPMILIFAFYSKTIRMLNSKIARRASYSTPTSVRQNFSSSDDYSEDSKFSSFKKMTRGLISRMSAKKTSQEKPSDHVVDNKVETNLKLTAEESHIETDSVTQLDVYKKSIIIDNSNNRVKIFIKCKYYFLNQ